MAGKALHLTAPIYGKASGMIPRGNRLTGAVAIVAGRTLIRPNGRALVVRKREGKDVEQRAPFATASISSAGELETYLRDGWDVGWAMTPDDMLSDNIPPIVNQFIRGEMGVRGKGFGGPHYVGGYPEGREFIVLRENAGRDRYGRILGIVEIVAITGGSGYLFAVNERAADLGLRSGVPSVNRAEGWNENRPSASNSRGLVG